VCSIKIPGTFSAIDSGEGLYVAGGIAFFNTWNAGDRITKVEVVDVDNILGYGADTVLKTYHDDQAASGNTGWYIKPQGFIEIEPIGGYGFVPAELYLRITGQKVTGTGTLYINIWAGRKSTE
jgi:hypothetical protein